MAVIRCPHCTKPNPDFLDVCQYCDHPLKTEAGAPAEDANRQPAAASQEPVQALSEWDSFEAEPPAPRAPQPTAEGAALPDWLSALEDESPTNPSPSASATLPDWLSAIETEADTAAVSMPSANSELPDWLDDEPSPVRSDDRKIGGSDAQTIAGADTPWSHPHADQPTSAPAEAALPDWLSAIRPAESPELAAPPSHPELPDWLHDDAGPEPSAPVPSTHDDTWRSGVATIIGGTGQLPGWLSDNVQAPAPEPATNPSALISRSWPDDSIDSVSITGPATERPAWLSEVTEPGPDGVLPDEPEPVLPTETPDWLQSLSPAEGSNALLAERPTGLPGDRPDKSVVGESGRSVVRDPGHSEEIERAELPAWLSAMRPVEVQAPESATGDGDQYEEAVGVLAGMRGVLRAEPRVVLPGKAAAVHSLTMTDSQARAAQILAAIARAETGAADPKAKRRFRLPVMRWTITLALIVAALIPFVVPGLFVPPQSISRMTEAAVTTVEALDPIGPILVAIDYEPGQAGELDPAASVLLRHLMRQGLLVATVSTSPGGAGLAQRLLNESASDFALSEYTHFVNLGYIPGGPAGVLAFGTSPRTVFLADFSGSGAVWNSTAVQDVQRLNDFSAVIVISGSPETARAWIEQTQRLLDPSKPFVVATSASADPLLRPYTASVGGPIDGYIAGLGGVAQYEAKAGLAGAGQDRFAQIGAVLWTAAAVIVIGNALSVLRHVRVKRQ